MVIAAHCIGMPFCLPPAAEDSSATLDQLAEKLNQLGVAFERGTATVDTATLPPELAGQDLSVGAAHPLRYDTNGLITFNSVKAAKPPYECPPR